MTQTLSLLSRDIDIFPAKTTTTNGEDIATHGKSRARLTRDNWLKVWIEEPAYPHTPHLLVNVLISEILSNTIGNNSIARRKQGAIVKDVDGVLYEITPQAGCGCGSRLKSLNTSELRTTRAGTPGKKAIPVVTGSDIQAILNNFPSLA